MAPLTCPNCGHKIVVDSVREETVTEPPTLVVQQTFDHTAVEDSRTILEAGPGLPGYAGDYGYDRAEMVAELRMLRAEKAEWLARRCWWKRVLVTRSSR